MKELKFIDEFDAIICLDGDFPDKTPFELITDKPIFASDGAAIRLINEGINFEKVIGDLDTLKRKNYFDKIDDEKKVYIEDQNHNDFDKTLNYVLEHHYNNILVLGMHGGEFEHSLNNWSVFIRYSKKMNLCIYESNRYGIPVDESINFHSNINEMISLIPQPIAELKSNGLKWDLNNEFLKLGTKEGARNLAIDKTINIKLISGSYLLFLDSRLPFSPKLY